MFTLQTKVTEQSSPTWSDRNSLKWGPVVDRGRRERPREGKLKINYLWTLIVWALLTALCLSWFKILSCTYSSCKPKAYFFMQQTIIHESIFVFFKVPTLLFPFPICIRLDYLSPRQHSGVLVSGDVEESSYTCLKVGDVLYFIPSLTLMYSLLW